MLVAQNLLETTMSRTRQPDGLNSLGWPTTAPPAGATLPERHLQESAVLGINSDKEEHVQQGLHGGECTTAHMAA